MSPPRSSCPSTETETASGTDVPEAVSTCPLTNFSTYQVYEESPKEKHPDQLPAHLNATSLHTWGGSCSPMKTERSSRIERIRHCRLTNREAPTSTAVRRCSLVYSRESSNSSARMRLERSTFSLCFGVYGLMR
jgi:hypothetical protein